LGEELPEAMGVLNFIKERLGKTVVKNTAW
jgi:hypothetical protein